MTQQNTVVAPETEGDLAAPSRRVRAWETVVDWVEERIYSGQLTVGDQLPAERDLAARLGVSRSAVREAMRTLQASGVVRSTVGAGPSGGTSVTANPHQALTRLLRLHIALENFPLDDITEARIVLESLAVASAAERADEDAHARIGRAMQALDSLNDADGFARASEDFHRAIAQASGNRLVGDMAAAIDSSVTPAHTGDPVQVRSAYRAVYQAIRDRRPTDASRLMEQLLRRMTLVQDRPDPN